MTTTSQIAEYKGRKYRLAWRGTTKYGERAKLQFFDGSKEFWVPAEAITVSAPRSYGFRHHSDNAPHGRTCDYCGARDCPRAWDPRDLCQED